MKKNLSAVSLVFLIGMFSCDLYAGSEVPLPICPTTLTLNQIKIMNSGKELEIVLPNSQVMTFVGSESLKNTHARLPFVKDLLEKSIKFKNRQFDMDKVTCVYSYDKVLGRTGTFQIIGDMKTWK